MKVAALDLGTNTFLCLIAEVSQGRITQIYSDEVQVVRLGQDVHKTKKFHPQALERARKTLTDFSKSIAFHQPKKVLAMATSASRDVGNSEELFKICGELKIPVEIIPGSREAEITFKGSVSGLSEQAKSLVVVDVGGGSTEIVLGTIDPEKGSKFEFGQSIDIGCVRLKEMFTPSYPVHVSQQVQMQNYIRQQLQPVIQKILMMKSVDEILAVAGTPTEIARIEIGFFDPAKIDGYKINAHRLGEWADKFAQSKVVEITEKYQVSVGRADVILPGVTILSEICQALKKEELVVSSRGVRFGIALELENRPS